MDIIIKHTPYIQEWMLLSRTSILLVTVLMMVLSSTIVLAPSSEAANESYPPADQIALGADQENSSVISIGIWIINVYGFNYPAGDYVFDYYIYFFWTDPNITTVNWYMMNGFPTTPATKQLVENGTTNSQFFEVYRVRANLSYPLEAGDHPLKEVALPITIEIFSLDRPLVVRWLSDMSGVDPGFKIVGWKVTRVDYSVVARTYPASIETDQAVMDIIIEREMIVAFPELILPPMIFCLISAFSFLLRMDDSSAFGLRIGLNTSMLISAVLFNQTVRNAMPPTSTVTFYMIFTIGVLVFLAVNLIITILGYFEFTYMKNPERLRAINRYGILISVAIPVVLVAIVIYVVF